MGVWMAAILANTYMIAEPIPQYIDRSQAAVITAISHYSIGEYFYCQRFICACVQIGVGVGVGVGVGRRRVRMRMIYI